MIIFNVTTIIEEDIQQEFLLFMHTVYFPAVLKTQKFKEAKLYRMTEPVNEGITYCAQYFAQTAEDLESYRNEYLPDLQQILMQQFPNKVVFFSSILAPEIK